MTVDCKHSEALLLDLAYGETSPELEREVRAHVAHCAQCSAALARIESGLQLARNLPLEQPSSALSDRLMRAARVQAEANLKAREVAATPAWETFTLWLRRLSMARQVQMAIVMLLIVGVGLWSVPQLRHRPEATGETVVSPDHEGEAGPSSAFAPAKPLDLAVDPHTRRIRAKGDEADEGAHLQAKANEPAPAAAPEPTAAPEQTPAAGEKKEALDVALAEKSARIEAKAPSAAREEDKLVAAAASAEAEQPELRKRASSAELPASPTFAPPPPLAADELQRAPARKAKSSADDALARNAYADAPLAGLSSTGAGATTAGGAPAGTLRETAATAYAQAMELYRAADYAGANAAFESLLARKDAGELRSSALLYQARSLRALGRCDLAAPRYESIVRSYVATSEAAPALSEGAACYDQLGLGGKATALLERGLAVPALAARARSTLDGRKGATAKPAAAAPAAAEAQ